jgi:hypothetical protein
MCQALSTDRVFGAGLHVQSLALYYPFQSLLTSTLRQLTRPLELVKSDRFP